MCGLTRVDRVRNECIRGSLDVTNITKKMRKNRLRWLGHVKRRINVNIVKKIREIRIERNWGRGRLKK